MLHVVDMIMSGIAMLEVFMVLYLQFKRKQYRVVLKKQIEHQHLYKTQIIKREDTE